MLLKHRIAVLISSVFFIAYAVLSIVRFQHYGAFGFDLGLRDQTVWEYSQFKAPITTIHFYPFKNILFDHFEPIYIPVSMLYWIWSSPIMLLLFEAALTCFSALAIYLIAKEKKLHITICFALLISYLAFYGVQHAMWFDVHSASFGTAFLAWFIYFINKKSKRWAMVFFMLTLLSKENMALLTFLVSGVWFLYSKQKVALYFAAASILYVIFIFGIYYPYISPDGYRYANHSGLTSNLFNVQSFVDTQSKKDVLFYSLAWFGFIPLLFPLFLIPAVGDLWNYFVIASDLSAAHGLFMHYRITLAPLLAWATIYAISQYRRLNTVYVGVYLMLCIIILQYMLHLPLSYLAKQWFWTKPSGVENINTVITYLPKEASVVSQNNITPHISHREHIFTLWPEKRQFEDHSPCGEKECDWFRWAGTPEYLITDTSPEWDIRHLLANREEYIKGLRNLERNRVVEVYKRVGSTTLYKVLK